MRSAYLHVMHSEGRLDVGGSSGLRLEAQLEQINKINKFSMCSSGR